MHSLNTPEIPQCRNTDPITSRLAKKSDTLDIRIVAALQSYGPQTCWELVKTLNAMRESTHHDPDNPPREITIDSVSTSMRPMARKGLVHEEGTKENTVRDTGNQVIIWAHGPSSTFRGEENTLPIRRTGPIKPRSMFEGFTPEDIEGIWLASGKDRTQFAIGLNVAVLKRITIV